MNISKFQVEKSVLNLAYSFGKKKEFEAIMSNCPLPKSTEMIALLLFDNGVTEDNIYELYKPDYINVRNYRQELNEKGWVDFPKDSNFQVLTEFLESERGKKITDEYFKNKFKDNTHYLKYLDGITKEQFQRFITWEEKVENKYYEKGVLRTSNILSTIISAIPFVEDYVPTKEDGPFFAGCQKYGDIIVKTFCGQGCYNTISFKDELSFTTE